MSSDYRPRGGRGGRRRRGGRNRSPQQSDRAYTNGSSQSEKKQGGFFSMLFGWITGKKSTSSKSESKGTRSGFSQSRSEFKERAPRPERTERPARPAREEQPPRQEIPAQEITSPKLYVGNLAYEAAESDLFDLFSKVGSVKNVEIAMDRRTNQSKGFGFVEMEALDTAKEAAAKLNRTDFMGRQIVVSGAKLERRTAGGPSREADPTAPEVEPGAESDPTL